MHLKKLNCTHTNISIYFSVTKIYQTLLLVSIDMCIKHFLRVYRQSFPNASITPKLHMLEDHTMEQLRRFKVGLGLLNEQCGELLHTEFNRAGRTVHGMKDELLKLMSIMRRHLTTTFPEVHAEMQK